MDNLYLTSDGPTSYARKDELTARTHAVKVADDIKRPVYLWKLVDIYTPPVAAGWSSEIEQPAQTEHGAELAPEIGDMVEFLGGEEFEDEDAFYPGKVLFADKTTRQIEYGGVTYRRSYSQIRRPSVKPEEKPFVFGERVLCGETFSGIDCKWHPGVVVKFKPNDRVCVWPEGSADWFVFEKDQLKHID